MTDAAAVAATYFDAWKARDFGRLRSVLADDVDFAGPLARVRGGDACLRGLQGMAHITTSLDVRKVFHDEPDVLTWFDLGHQRGRPGSGGELDARRARQDHPHQGGLRRQGHRGRVLTGAATTARSA
jgi:ketosteroid isomerase-like protein